MPDAAFSTALHVLNDAAYAAAKLARKSGHPLADRLKTLALDTDEIVDIAYRPAAENARVEADNHGMALVDAITGGPI